MPADLPYDLESLPADNQSPNNAKIVLENVINAANYISANPRVANHLLEARWALGAVLLPRLVTDEERLTTVIAVVLILLLLETADAVRLPVLV